MPNRIGASPRPSVEFIRQPVGIPSDRVPVSRNGTVNWERLAETFTNAQSFTSVQAALDATEDAGGGTVFVPAGTYNEHLTVGTSVTLMGAGPATIIQGTDSDTDVIKMTGSYSRVCDLQVKGEAASGNGYGINIYPTGVLLHPRIQRVLIPDTPKWGIYVGRDDATNIAVNTLIEDCEIYGNRDTATGGLHVGSGCAVVNCARVFFNGNNTTGTFSHGGGDTQRMGQVHLKNASLINFFGCIFEPTSDSVCISLSSPCYEVSLFGCYFEHEDAGNRYFLIETAGNNTGLLLLNCRCLSHSTTQGLKILDTDSAAALSRSAIIGGDWAFKFDGTNDVVLNAAADELLLQNAIGYDATTPVPRRLRVSLPAGGTEGVSQTKLWYLNQDGSHRWPLLTTTLRDALPDVLAGEIIVNTTTGTVQRRLAGAWASVP